MLAIAKNAYARLGNTKNLTLIDTIERRSGGILASDLVAPSKARERDKGGLGGAAKEGRLRLVATTGTERNGGDAKVVVIPPLEFTWMAELMAYEGHYHEAAKIYARNGKIDEAIRIFSDLKMWEDAKMFAKSAGAASIEGSNALAATQAKWLQDIKDWKASAELFVSMGQHTEAARAVGEFVKQETDVAGWQEALIEVVRSCPLENTTCLQYCGDVFAHQHETGFAKEAFTKSKDISRLMNLYAKQQLWEEARCDLMRMRMRLKIRWRRG